MKWRGEMCLMAKDLLFLVPEMYVYAHVQKYSLSALLYLWLYLQQSLFCLPLLSNSHMIINFLAHRDRLCSCHCHLHTQHHADMVTVVTKWEQKETRPASVHVDAPVTIISIVGTVKKYSEVLACCGFATLCQMLHSSIMTLVDLAL